MANYEDHTKVTKMLVSDQEAERDRRDTVREVHRFLDDDDGQWEDHVKNTMTTQQRPRYSFDRCNDIVDDIAGEMEQADFDIKVKPSGGDATKDIAKTYDGLIRNIENLSNAVDVYNSAGRSMVRAGFDCWIVNQRWGDNDTFDQDLYIDPIADAVDRVWFDRKSVLQTREDANHGWLLQNIDKDTYKEKWPKGSGQSVSQDDATYDDADVIIVGQIFYKVKRKTRIVEMSNGAVYKDDEKYQSIKDELAKQNITEKRSRDRMMDVVKTRLFDGGGWLKDAEDTVFDYIPLVPTYGNFSVSEKKVVYWGIITKKMDAQRVFNYAESRKVEEGALAPLEKILATDEQVDGHEDEWSKLNTSADPALLYSHQLNAPPPYKIGGAQINPGLESVSQAAQMQLQSTAGLDRLPGEALGLQSGVAVELKQNKGDTRNYKYTVSQEKAICHTAKILIHAIPKVYDSKRQVRILNEDDSFDMVLLNEPVFDEDTQRLVTLNDMNQGVYDVTCSSGQSFKNRQSETASAFTEMAAIDPSILEEGKDIWYGSLQSPGFDHLAERARRNMLLQGAIPEEQMTDEEKEFLKEQPEPEPDPMQVALEAEAENESDKIQVQAIRAATEEKKVEHAIQMDQLNAQTDSMAAALELVNELANELKTKTETLKMLRESQGVEGAGPNASLDALVDKQAAVVADSQAEQQ